MQLNTHVCPQGISVTLSGPGMEACLANDQSVDNLYPVSIKQAVALNHGGRSPSLHAKPCMLSPSCLQSPGWP